MMDPAGLVAQAPRDRLGLEGPRPFKMVYDIATPRPVSISSRSCLYYQSSLINIILSRACFFFFFFLKFINRHATLGTVIRSWLLTQEHRHQRPPRG